MSILLSLSPFLVFFALMRLASPLAGLVAAFAVSVLLCLRMAWRRESVKILEIGTAALFGGLVAYTLLAAPEWTVATVRLAVDTGLFAIAAVSLAIRQPFTLQYARERVPEPIWALPVFYTTNRAITTVWAIAFGLHVAADAAAEYAPAIPIWFDVAVVVGALAAAVWFSNWYPNVVRRRFQPSAA